ncbi:MAG: terminase large subunit [Candidatus Moranbacteria bacterium]|nr:terminase large subunit [Candidatus Moranbacteria bacterium]
MTKIKPITREKLIEYKKDISVFLQEQYILEDGKPIALEEFQKKILRDIFQTKDKNGLRKYNLALVGVPKKNGKSTLASGIALYMLFADVSNAEVYSVAGDKDQAKIIFQMTKKAIERNPILLDSVKIYKDEIIVPSTNSVYKVLSADAPTLHGLNGSAIIFDEIWNQPNRDLYDALTQSPVRKEPLTFIVTYAGTDQASLLYELYKTGVQKKDAGMYFFWSENNLAKWVTPRYLEQQRMRLPAGVYQRLHENKWVQGANAFLTKAELDKCIDPILKPQLSGKGEANYFLAVDLGLTRDRTVLTICHRNKEDNLIYLDYIRTFQGTKSDPVLISDVEESIMACNKSFNVAKNIFDPWQMKSTAERMKRIIKVEEFTFTSNSIQKLSQNLFYLFHNSLIRIFPHKLLEEELLSLNAAEKSYGWRIDHKSGGFSDHSVSLGMSSMFAVQNDEVDAGFLITDSPTFDEFMKEMEEEKKQLEPKIIEVKEERRQESISPKQNFPTLRELEQWRKEHII